MYSEQGYVGILKQLLFSYFINFLIFLIAPFSTVVLSRGLSLQDFGVYSLFFTFWNVGLHLGSGGLYLFMQNYLPGRNASEQKSVSASFFQFIFLAVGVFFIFWWLFLSGKVLVWLNISEYLGSSFLVVLAVFVSALATIPQTWIGANQKLEFCTFLYFINSTLWIILSALEFLIFNQIVVWHVFMYWVFGSLMQISLSFWYIGRESFSLLNFLNFRINFVFKGLYFGLFALPLVVGPWLFSTIDRMFLSHYVGQDVIGVYSVAFALVNVVSSFAVIVSGIFYSYISKARNLGDGEKCVFLWNAALKYTLLIVLPGIVGVFVLREALITLIAGSKFLGALSLMPYFGFIPFFASLIFLFQMALLIHGRPVVVGVIYVLGVVFNYVLNSQLVPLFGIDGAAIALFLTNFLMVFCMFFASRKFVHFKWAFVKFFRIFVSALVMGGVLFFFNPVNLVMKLIVILFGVLVYLVCVIFLKVFGSDELLIVKGLVRNSFLEKIFFWV